MKLKITVHGVAYEVDVEVLDPGEGFPPASPLPVAPGRAAAARTPTARSAKPPTSAAESAPNPAARSGPGGVRHSVASPVAGTVLEVRCKTGEAIEANAILFVLEAMKMKTSIVAPERGRIGQVLVAPGDAVVEGQPLLHYD